MSDSKIPAKVKVKGVRDGKYCCVVNCSNNTVRESHLKFWICPNRDQQQRELWIKAVHRKNPDGTDWKPGPSTLICSAHFVDGIKSNIQTHPSYAPSIFPTQHLKEKSAIDVARFNRAQARLSKSLEGTTTTPPQPETGHVEDRVDGEERHDPRLDLDNAELPDIQVPFPLFASLSFKLY